ncbi:BolA family protein [Amorphus coralli]|uniref:BolA family protein n=1 Tax=Amorphus coralli TaxID=340680 RepID=UPI00036BFE1A|nr:BolA family protein [Amorphus coralli]
MPTTRDTIEAKLTEALQPNEIEITDESHLHAGHSGWREGGETHFRVRVVSEAFSGKGRVDRHRLVNAILADELGGGVHALAMKTLAPGEPG